MIVTFAVLGSISACRDHQTAQSGHDASHSQSGPISQTQGAAALAPPEGASVKILSPRDGQVLEGDSIPLEFEIKKGKRGEHVHAYIDGELAGMFKTSKGTLSGIKPGSHTLEVRVVTADHNSELDATDEVRFVVK